MEIYYRREIQHNYLIIEPDECQGWSYEVKMLIHNSIDGLLKFRMKLLDGEQQFFYEITSKQPLSRILESRNITADEIRKLITAIAAVLNKIELFLLTPQQILLQADYIYLEPEEFQVYFCLIPGKKAEFSEELKELLYYLLKKVDHQDQESVILAYGMYQETQKENYGIADLMRFLSISHGDQKENEEKIVEMMVTENSIKDKADIPEQQQKMENRQEIAIKTAKVIAIIGWIGLVGGIAAIYALNRIDFLWQIKEVILLLFAVLVCGSFYIGYLEFKAIKEKKDSKENLGIEAEKADEEKNKSDMSEMKWRLTFDGENTMESEDKEMKTQLLSSVKNTQEGHYLMSLQEECDDILLSYFPFIIGKAEHMADYVIPRASISRMHVKIDRAENGYQITDLNSTNGTWVEEHQLEANETCPLEKDDKVKIADLFFRFK